MAGLRHSRTPDTGGTAGAPSSRGASWPRAAATTSSPSPTTTRASSASSTPRPRHTPSTTATSARCSGRPGRTATTSGRRSREGGRPTDPPASTLGNQWETIFDRALREQPRQPPRPRRDHRALLQLGPSLLRRLGRARGELDPAARRVLRRLRRRNPAQHLDRRPALPRWRRRRRPLGGRASARGRPPRPGLDVGCRPRLHGVPQLSARRDVHHLRRVGRLLRPCPARRAFPTTAAAPT